MDALATLLVVVPGFFVFGAALHWVFARFSISPFNSLLVTFGVTVIIESLIQWIWTADYRRLESHYGEIKFRVGTLFVPLPELLTLLVAIALALGTWAALRYTDLGKALRAAAEDAPIAAASASTSARWRSRCRACRPPSRAWPGPASPSAIRWRRPRSTPGSGWCSPRS